MKLYAETDTYIHSTNKFLVIKKKLYLFNKMKNWLKAVNILVKLIQSFG